MELPNMGAASKEGLDKYVQEATSAAEQQQHLKRFTRHVTKEMGKADKLLKVLLAPHNVLVDTYKSIIGADGSEADFQKVMDLKVCYWVWKIDCYWRLIDCVLPGHCTC
jgi:hypothetical protein